MSKGLESLENIKNFEGSYGTLYDSRCEELNQIEKELQRLEAIDNAKPSEALKCVDVLKEDDCITTLYQGKALETIRQYILKAQEQEKALEILKKKVDFVFFGRSKEVKIEQVDSEDSLYLMNETGDTILPEEEFDTLKRLLSNDTRAN